MAAWYAVQGMTLFDALEALYRKYGFYGEKTHNLVMPGLDGLEKMAALMKSLRAAPPTHIAGVEVLLLSLFFLGVQRSGIATLWELLVQFLLPCNVSCCICFSCLYSRRVSSEALCLVLCGIWTAFWESLLLRDAVYQAVSPILWGGLLALSLLFLGWIICRGQRSWRKTWEVKPIWN